MFRQVTKIMRYTTIRIPKLSLSHATRNITNNNNTNNNLVNFGGVMEKVYTRDDYPITDIQGYFKNDIISVIGYGPQGRAQALNIRDNGLNVIVGARNHHKPKQDGFIPNKDLFPIEEAVNRSSIVLYLLSDAGQVKVWPYIKRLLNNKTLCFSHGFGIVYNDKTNIIPDASTNVIMVAPKGTGNTLRTKFVNSEGVNSSIAVHQDYNNSANRTAQYLGFAIGSGYLYETTFEKEVFSDLFGERGVLMGAIHGLFLAQYNILREMGHSPSEAFNETVEEATQSLYPLIGEKGMDWMYANCSTTAQRGAIDWYPRFQKATEPLFRELYQKVVDGTETDIVLNKNKNANYREELDKELNEISQMEIWKAGKVVRGLRK